MALCQNQLIEFPVLNEIPMFPDLWLLLLAFLQQSIMLWRVLVMYVMFIKETEGKGFFYHIYFIHISLLLYINMYSNR